MADPFAGRYAALRIEIDRIWTARPDPAVPLRLLEVGTYDAQRAVAMIGHWGRKHRNAKVEYWGFDLWEDLTPDKSRAENSKKNPPPSVATAHARLVGAGASVHLTKGDTRDTLTAAAAKLSVPPVDLVWLDGGHSLETIASDWAAVARMAGPLTVVLLDDYYPDRTDMGCKPLVDDRIAIQDTRWVFEVLPRTDHFPETGVTVQVARAAARLKP